MCLYYNKNRKAEGWHVAKEDIVCYKVLSVTRILDSSQETITGFRYSTPFQDMPVKLDETYNNTDEVNECELATDQVRVKGGVFHSYAYLFDANREAESMSNYIIMPGGFIVVTSIIPKGTRFVMGRTNDGKVCFASRTLKITDDVLFIQYCSVGALGKLKIEHPNAKYAGKEFWMQT